MKLIKIGTDTKMSVIEKPDNIDTLEFLREQIGCSYVDVVNIHHHPPVDLWLDDEGLFMGDKRPNLLASLLARYVREMHGVHDDSVYYGVGILAGVGKTGETLGLTDEVIERTMHIGEMMGRVISAAVN